MAEDIRHFTVTIPTGTTPAAPAVISIAMPVRTVSRVEWKVPPGPMGTMSFLLSMAGVPVLPVYGQKVYVTTDGKDGSWQVDSYPDSGAWQVTGYNSGTYPHSLLLTFWCQVPRRPAGLLPLIPAYELMPSPDLSRAGPPVEVKR